MPQEIEVGNPESSTVFDGFSDVVISPKEKTDAGDNLENKIIVPEEKKIDTPPAAPTEDGRNYLKERLGYDDWDSAKNEIETLRTKSQTPAEIKYANDKSKHLAEAWQAGKIDDVYNYLDSEVKLNKLTTGDVTEANAPDIIKAAMKEKYKGLTSDQVNYKFNKQFSIPKEPVMGELDDAEEFKSKHEAWQSTVNDIKMDMMIEANLARPELEKLKSELKLPEIPQLQQTDKPLSPEELELVKKGMELFVQTAENEINKFEGFNVEYKDKDNDVNIKSTYALSNEEKASVLGKLKLLAEKNYNSNAIFAQRWVNDDETFNFSQMAKDIALLETNDKMAQKFVSDTAAKAKKQFIKEKHHIDLNDGSGSGDLQLEDKEKQKKMEDALWA